MYNFLSFTKPGYNEATWSYTTHAAEGLSYSKDILLIPKEIYPWKPCKNRFVCCSDAERTCMGSAFWIQDPEILWTGTDPARHQPIAGLTVCLYDIDNDGDKDAIIAGINSIDQKTQPFSLKTSPILYRCRKILAPGGHRFKTRAAYPELLQMMALYIRLPVTLMATISQTFLFVVMPMNTSIWV